MQASALSTRTVRPLPVAARRHRLQPVASANPQVTVSTKKVIDVSEANFEAEVLQSDKPVMVDFWASWCGPCRLVAPLMEWTEKEYGSQVKVVKVEHDKNKALIEKYKVYGLPTLLLFKDGQEIAGSKREGAITKPLITDYLKKHQIIA